VRLLGSIYEEHELAPWYLTADVFCYPANIGLSIIHAMAYDLPVITHDNLRYHGPEIEILKNHLNGIFYKYNDDISLLKALEAILTNPDLRNFLSINAGRTVRNSYSIKDMADGIVNAIHYCVRK
jgi:glycosyltransferase involved in cell wall biosynthesis